MRFPFSPYLASTDWYHYFRYVLFSLMWDDMKWPLSTSLHFSRTQRNHPVNYISCWLDKKNGGIMSSQLFTMSLYLDFCTKTILYFIVWYHNMSFSWSSREVTFGREHMLTVDSQCTNGIWQRHSWELIPHNGDWQQLLHCTTGISQRRICTLLVPLP